MTNKQLIDLQNKYVAHNYKPLPVVLTRGHGVWVYDVEGKKYMDCLSAFSSVNQGHTNKKLAAVIKKQVTQLTMTSRAFYSDQLALFAKELCKLAGFEMMLPMNSGAEAVETAIKVVRKYGYVKKGIPKDKAEIIVAAGNFHGRTITVVGFSTEETYKDGFGPFTPGFKVVPYNNVKAIEKAINKNTIAVLIEPIQIEGGIIVPDEGYLSKVAALCKKKKVFLMYDEIQTGLGRTGKLFAFQHEKDAKPDVLILGKALSAGCYPVSAVLASKEIFSVIGPGSHGSTFSGNQLASAIARTALKILVEEKLSQNSAKLGAYFMQKVKTIKSPLIKDIRGRGLVVGIELTKESGGARKYCEQLAKEGILCKETHDMVIRMAPPLIITKKEIDYAFAKLKKVLEV